MTPKPTVTDERLDEVIGKVIEEYHKLTWEEAPHGLGMMIAQAVRTECQQASEAGWQEMAEKFVGMSPAADMFVGEPHNPEAFGNYVLHLLERVRESEAREREAVEWGMARGCKITEEAIDWDLSWERQVEKGWAEYLRQKGGGE